jgi:eukaryotic-like serine/threonine-protein kinase
MLWNVNTGSRVESSPLVDKNNVLIANMRGDLMVLRQSNGATVWTFELGSPVIGSPAVIQNRILVTTQDGAIYCLGN